MKSRINERKEAGREHVKRLGYAMVNGETKLEKELNRRFRRSMQDLAHVSDEDGGDGYAFYDRKNEDYDVAMFVTGAYDADIVRKACNWIDGHRECFGDTILEIGCDVGAMTTFLGLVFPEKRILAIDRCPKGVDVARRNCERLGVTNVELRCCDVAELDGEEFDTVFSMRTFHENDTTSGLEPGYVFAEYARAYADGFSGYAKTVAGLIKAGGNLVSIEKFDRDSIMAGFLDAIGDAGLRPDMEAYEELRCRELGYSDVNLQAMSSAKDPQSEFDPVLCYVRCFTRYTDPTEAFYQGFEARTMFWGTGGELIRGFVGKIDGQIAYRYEARRHKDDTTCIVTYCSSGGNTFTGYHDVSELQAVMDDMSRRELEAMSAGYDEIVPVEDADEE